MKRASIAFVLAVLGLVASCTNDPTSPTGQLKPPAEALRPALVILPPGNHVVKPSSMSGWYFWNDKNDTFTGSPGELVAGPSTPPLGTGSVRLGPLTDNGTTAAGHSVIATDDYLGTRLDAITTLTYSTYQPGPTLAIALQFDVRYRPGDLNYGGRLIFEPYQNGLVTVGAGWQSWSPLAGTWWASKTTAAGTGGTQVVPLPAGNCGQATPCTWSQLLAAFPDAVIAGRLLLKAGSNWSGFDGNADALTVGVSGANVTFDFEPETPCTLVCYADATAGNDAFGGGTPSSAKKTIQAALNQVSAGGQVRVLPGSYDESAPGSSPTSLAGTYQFGLFFGSAKPGITLMGVDALDQPIVLATGTLATITTNATNNFGYSGIFVEAANTTIRGVTIGPNTPGDNKTIEVVADNFTLQYARTAVPGGGGSVYINDFSAPGDVVKSYHVLDNLFPDGTSVDISSGAGNTGPVSGREILRNTWALAGSPYNAVSFNGSGGVAWFVNPVGGAIIKNNSFSGGSDQYIRARGTYPNAQFDWQSYWQDNSYDKASVALVTEAPFDVRTWSYDVFTNVRRIGATIQGEVNHSQPGDVVLVKAGTYPESVTIPRALTLKGAGIGSTVLQGTGGVGTGISLAAGLSGVTIQQLTTQGYNYGIQMTSGPLSNITVQDVAAIDNNTHGIWVQAFGINNMAFVRINASRNNAAGGLAGRGLWIINGVKTGVSVTDGTFNDNGLVGIDLSDGNVTGATITGNTVIGNGDAGIAVLGARGPQANLVANNVVTNNGRFGIEIKVPTGNGAASVPGSIVVRNNTVSRTVPATDARDHAGIAVYRRSGVAPDNDDQPTGVVVTENAVSGYTRKPSGSTGDGFGIVVEGTGHVVTKNLVSGNDIGIQIQQGNTANVQSTPFFDRGDATPSSAVINRNSLTGNLDLDLRNVGAGPTDATCNWYGASSGPVAGKLSGSLTTTPWLLSSNLAGACNNAPPTVVTAALDALRNEGQTLSTSGAFSGAALVLSRSGTVGVFTDHGDGTWSWSLPTTDDVPLGTITVTATDVYGATVTDAFNYKAANVAPSLTIITPSPGKMIPRGTSLVLKSAFTDPGAGDTHTCTFAWGDLGTTGPVASGPGKTCNASHLYASSGTFTISVTVQDDDLGLSTKTRTITVFTVAKDKSQCKRDGWKDVRRADGSRFRNQGECVSYVERRGKDDHHRGHGDDDHDDDDHDHDHDH